MRLFNRYFIKIYLIAIIQISIVSAILIFLIDLVELSRRFDEISNIAFYELIKLSIYKLPSTFEDVSPIIIVIGTLTCLFKLSKSSEIVISNAIGISVWQIILPITLCAILFGLTIVIILNPISIQMKYNFIQLEKNIKGNDTPFDQKLDKEFWSSQKNNIGELIINAEQLDVNDQKLVGVTILQFNEEMDLVARYDSTSAYLDDGQWYLDKTWVTDQDNISKFMGKTKVNTFSDELFLQEEILKSSEQSIWTIKDTITKLKKNNISYAKHLTDLNFFLSLPILMGGLALVSACFMAKQFRVQHALIMLILGIISGMLIFVVNHISYILSESEIFNPILGAWWHIILIYLIATKILILREDG